MQQPFPGPNHGGCDLIETLSNEKATPAIALKQNLILVPKVMIERRFGDLQLVRDIVQGRSRKPRSRNNCAAVRRIASRFPSGSRLRSAKTFASIDSFDISLPRFHA